MRLYQPYVRADGEVVWGWLDFPDSGGGGGVRSFNGRKGAVMPKLGDYSADLVTYDRIGYPTVKAALDELFSAPPAGVTSFNGRMGVVVPLAGDYSSAIVSDASTVGGPTVEASLNTLSAGKQSTLPLGVAGDILVSTGAAWVPTSLVNRSAPTLFDCNTDPAISGWGRSLSGTGQIFAISGTPSTHPGQWALRIGSASGSRSALHLGPATGGVVTPDAAMTGFFETMLQVPSLNGGGQTFEAYCGFADNASAATVSNGVFFYVNTSNELRARRVVGGVVGVDALVAALSPAVWYRLRAEFVGTNVVLSWAQTESRTVALTTVLTSAKIAVPQSPQLKFVRLSGSSTRDLLVDYLSWYLPSV